jgi:predicted kinase
MTKGLPASGKTTWAKEQLTKGRIKRINKDDLRAMLDNGQWSKQNEGFVIHARDRLIDQALNDGWDVIVDDTNLAPQHEKRLREIAAGQYGVEARFEIKDFTDVSLSTCLKRDSERANSVGEKVIKTMYNSYLKQKSHVAQYSTVPYKEGFPYCLIVDIDGTLAHMNGRSPYDYTMVHTDIVDENVRDVVRRYTVRDPQEEIPDTYIIVVSGREDNCQLETKRWLFENGIPYDEIYMRKTGDMRDDRIVKKEIYEEFIKPRYNVRFVLDDRDRVVKMWREEGLKVLQVAEGDF